MYQNFIFDLYGTLIDINTNEWKPYLWSKMSEFYGFYGANYQPMEMKRAYERLIKEAFEVKSPYEYPEIQLEYVFQSLASDKGIEMDLTTAKHAGQFFRILSTKYIKLYDGVIDLLTLIKKNGKHAYVLSNAQRIFTAYEMTLLGIDHFFDGILISSDEKCMKPDPAFFQRILDRYHLKKEESIMIGNDYRSDINGAYRIGMDSFYLHSNLSPEIKGELHATYHTMKLDLSEVMKLV